MILTRAEVPLGGAGAAEPLRRRQTYARSWRIVPKLGAIPLRPCHRLAASSACVLVRMSGRRCRARTSVKIPARPVVREPDLVAAGVWHGRVPDDAGAVGHAVSLGAACAFGPITPALRSHPANCASAASSVMATMKTIPSMISDIGHIRGPLDAFRVAPGEVAMHFRQTYARLSGGAAMHRHQAYASQLGSFLTKLRQRRICLFCP